MNAWTAIAGAARWASCSPATAEEAARRASVCGACPSRVIVRVRGTDLQAAFCGPPLEDHGGTCGCLVQWRVGASGAWKPAGKVTCTGEGCPSNHW